MASIVEQLTNYYNTLEALYEEMSTESEDYDSGEENTSKSSSEHIISQDGYGPFEERRLKLFHLKMYK